MLARDKRERGSRRRVHRSPTKRSVAAAVFFLSPGPPPPVGTYSRGIVDAWPTAPMSTDGVRAALPKLESDAFSRCGIPARGHIRPSPKSPAHQDETAINPRPHAAAIVVSSSGADVRFECLGDLKYLSPKQDLKFLEKFSKLYILLSVDREFMAVADKIKEETTRGRVERDLSNNKSVTLEIKDLYKLDGFLGWPWNDIQKRLEKIKKKLKFILYVKKNGQLVKAIKDLHLDHVYLLDDTECATVEGRWTVLKVGNFVP